MYVDDVRGCKRLINAETSFDALIVNREPIKVITLNQPDPATSFWIFHQVVQIHGVNRTIAQVKFSALVPFHLSPLWNVNQIEFIISLSLWSFTANLAAH